MDVNRFIDLIPLWGVFFIMVASILLAVEAGSLVGTRERKRVESGAKASAGETVAATLGLVALMLAFTFNLAASRYDTRRALVLDEANAIGTTFLRTGLLAEPHRSTIRNSLREYVEVRLKAVQGGNVADGIKRSTELQNILWKEAEAVGTGHPDSEMVALFIESLNEVIDLHSKRVTAGIRSRVPATIWGGLYLVSLAGFAALGYQIGLSEERKRTAAVVVACGFAVVMVLIADLDRPQEGLLRVSQQALVDTLESMKGTK